MEKQLQDLLEKLRYEEYDEVSGFIEQQRRLKLDDYIEKSMSRYEQNRQSRLRSKEKERTEVLPLLKKFVSGRISIGSVVSFRGTRGSSYRKIIAVSDDRIMGNIVRKDRAQLGNFVCTGGASENQIANLDGYYDETTNKWLNKKQILEIAKQM